MTPHFQTDFPPAEFAARRSRLFDRLGAACALVQGAGPVERSEAFRQTNEFYYLCGVEIPQAYLFLDGRRRSTTLFLPHRDDRRERSEGPGFAAEDEPVVRDLSGVDAVRPIEELGRRLINAPEIYTPHSPAEGLAGYRDELVDAAARRAADPWDDALARESEFIKHLRVRFPAQMTRDLSPLLDELRLIKSTREIDLMRRAGRITAEGVCAAIRSTRPGVFEFQLGAVAQYVHRLNGAAGDGYRAIIAGGERIWYGHYFRNDQELKNGEVVLMDYAPDYHYYTSDIGRTWPVNGRFDDRRRELYGYVTRYHQALLRRIRPGVAPAQILEEAAAEMAETFDSKGFSKSIYEQAFRRALTFAGHLSHPVGMAVHDVGSYSGRPLEPGLVFSVDPQVWIPEEKLYIRVEDTVAVTCDGIENLTAFAPLELEEIEAMVGQSGIIQSFPPIDLQPAAGE